MKRICSLLIIMLFLFVGCGKKRSASDYRYYQPYIKNSAKDTIKKATLEVDSIQQITNEPKIDINKYAGKGVDLNDSYFIIVANYVNKDNAERRKQSLVSKGFKPELFMVNNDGWYKLAVKSYKTLPEAELGLKQMIDNKIVDPDAYIVFNRNK